jgi:hypothetical protein
MGLTLKEYADEKQLPIDSLKRLGLRQIEWHGKPALRIPYYDVDGIESCRRVRISMKDDRFRWEKGATPILYGLWLLRKMKSQYICVVEGESDYQTLWHHRFAALGLPGASSWDEAWADLLDPFERIYVTVEPDKGGQTVLKWLGTSKIRERTRLVMLDGVKDVSELYLSDPANFKDAWKAALKAAIPWSELLKTEEQDQPRTPTQVQSLLRLAEEATLFRTPDDIAFASVPVNGHVENWAIRSRKFRRWLLRGYYKEAKSAPQTHAFQECIAVLESKASFEGPECPTFVRLAENEGKIYLDLCNETWKAIEIDPDGWRLIGDAPVKFRRARGMYRLPEPTRDGSIDELRRFINVGSHEDWILVVAWLVAALCPRGPYPILTLHGEQGSAKSTTARVLRALVDPSTAPLRSEPRELRDLMIAASNGWMIALDNLSSIPVWLSDALCRLSTGGGFSTRELFTDDEETLIDVQRPVILNGIHELAVRSDLLDRALILYLPSIPEDERQPEKQFWRDFEEARPVILGALLDVVCDAMRRLPKIQLPNTPRLADFAIWATAAERSLGWEDGTFLKAYRRNQSDANDLALEASPITEPIRHLLAQDDYALGFEANATTLLNELAKKTDESIRRQKGWPQSALGLSNMLKRLAPNLRKSGIEAIFGERSKDRERRRLITLRNIASTSSKASKSSLPRRGFVRIDDQE